MVHTVSPPPRVRARIFIVEDEVIVARDIRQELIELGYEPAGHSTTAEECLLQLGTVKPDLIVMDIQLAGAMDGISAAQIARSEHDIPVVFLTAFAAEDVLARAKLTEPFGYILKPFSSRELRTVLEMALYKAQADRELKHYAELLQQMTQRVMRVQEEERKRVALELHDDLGQNLTSLKINLSMRNMSDEAGAAELDKRNMQLVNETIEKVRSLTFALRPAMLDVLGLPAAIEGMLEQRVKAGTTISFQNQVGQRRYAADMEICFFRVAQEAVTNIFRHAGACTATITLMQSGDMVTLQVSDDGNGFDNAAATARGQTGNSFGLMGMRERAAQIGAALDIASSPGAGCKLQLQWRVPQVIA